MEIPNCLYCKRPLIELKTLDFKCEVCKKKFELFWCGFSEPMLREIKC